MEFVKLLKKDTLPKDDPQFASFFVKDKKRPRPKTLVFMLATFF